MHFDESMLPSGSVAEAGQQIGLVLQTEERLIRVRRSLLAE